MDQVRPARSSQQRGMVWLHGESEVISFRSKCILLYNHVACHTTHPSTKPIEKSPNLTSKFLVGRRRRCLPASRQRLVPASISVRPSGPRLEECCRYVQHDSQHGHETFAGALTLPSWAFLDIMSQGLSCQPELYVSTSSLTRTLRTAFLQKFLEKTCRIAR